MRSKNHFDSKRALWISAIGASILIACMTYFLATGSSSKPSAPRVVANDLSVRPKICLAADTATAENSGAVTTAWAAARSAGAANNANVQQLITAAADQNGAQPYLAGLVNQRCDLVITVGKPFGQSIKEISAAAPTVRFAAIDSFLDEPPGGSILIDDADISTRVADEVRSLSGSRRGQASPAK